jgi:hypothetical protein
MRTAKLLSIDNGKKSMQKQERDCYHRPLLVLWDEGSWDTMQTKYREAGYVPPTLNTNYHK